MDYNRPMKSTRQLTAIIEREADSYVALELFFESADPTEVARRLHSEVFITRVEVAVG